MRRNFTILGIALLAFTLSPILIRYSDLPSSLIVAGRLLLSLLFMLPFWLRTRGKEKLKLFVSPQLLLSGLMLGIHFVLWTISLDYTSVSSASVAVCIAPVFIVGIERLILKRAISKRVATGLAAALFGVALLLFDDLRTQAHGGFGIVLALFAAFLSAIYLLIGENARKTHRLFDYCMPVYTIGMLTAFAWGWLQGHAPLDLFAASTREWWVIAGLAVFPTILGHTAFNYILKTFSASTLSIAGLTEPFLATIAAYWLFMEVPTGLGIIGGLLTLIGVYWVLAGEGLKEASEPIQ